MGQICRDVKQHIEKEALQLSSIGGHYIGLGEISAVEGLHQEDFNDVHKRLWFLKDWIKT